MRTSESLPRVLLVEFAAFDRFHRGIALPFLQRMVRDAGLQARWLRYGVRAATREAQKESGIALCDEDLQTLVREAEGWGATHVLFGQSPAASTVDAFQRALPRLRLGLIHDDAEFVPSDDGRVHSVAISGHDLAGFLNAPSLAETPACHYSHVTPDFTWIPGNDAAIQAPSLPFLICGEECTFRAPLRHNPKFQDLDLSACERKYGCAFCVRPSGRAHWSKNPVELFRIQLTALRDTHPPWQGQLQVRGVGEPILHHIEAVVDVLLQVDIPPIALLIDGRADGILQVRDALHRALPRLDGSPHALHMSLVGIESFVGDELMLLNKGLSWDQNLDAIATLFELEHRHGDSFAFRQHGGLSLLLFTPWTRAEHTSLNLAVIRRCRLSKLSGKIFTSRLRLYPSLPLYALARRDGLVVERYDDPLLDTARMNLYADEVPWTFAQPGMETLSRLMVRLGRTDAPDSLARELREAVGDGRGVEKRLALAEAMVDVVLASPDATPSSVVIEARRRMAENDEKPGEESPAEGDPAGISPLLLSAEIGQKPVTRLERADLIVGYDTSGLERTYRAVHRRERVTERGCEPEVFFGRDPDLVAEAIELTDRMDCAKDDDEWRACAARVGVLLGYPRCCAEAFASRAPFLRANYMWLYLMGRLEARGPVPPLLNPGLEQLVNYVPCSGGCQATHQRARELLEAIRRRSSSEAEALEESSLHPWILLLDFQGAAAELVTDAEPKGRFPYRAGMLRGGHPLIQAIGAGDELDIDDQHIFVLRNGRIHASLGGRAFVWWHQAPVQREFLSRLVSLRFSDNRVDADPHARYEDDAPFVGPAARRLAGFIESVFRRPDRDWKFSGFRITRAEGRKASEAVVTLSGGRGSFQVVVAPRTPDVKGYIEDDPIVVFHETDSAIDTVDKDLAVRSFAALLAKALRRNARRRGRG